MGNKKYTNKSSKPLPELKILIIEDNEDHLKRMKEIVDLIEGNNKEFSLSIDTAESKEKAEKILFKDGNRYHILIVDIMLGQYKDGGMEIIERLKESSVLVVSSASLVVSHRFDGSIRQKAKKFGVKAYFTKPLQLREFRKKLLETIEESLPE
jgi:response regulator RpfG family c-di-GMP phosphodiesterase